MTRKREADNTRAHRCQECRDFLAAGGVLVEVPSELQDAPLDMFSGAACRSCVHRLREVSGLLSPADRRRLKA